MAGPIDALILQFLRFVAERSPTGAEVLDAWQSSCPRLTVWEDAMIGGLVAFDGTRERRVVLTEAGRHRLAVGTEGAGKAWVEPAAVFRV
ncbi:MAG TPA: hypothetical protein VN702_10705 [Acetobacteraceae bacterium]|nr:hypothetical protein [Acetobacteraceae bacterium]